MRVAVSDIEWDMAQVARSLFRGALGHGAELEIQPTVEGGGVIRVRSPRPGAAGIEVRVKDGVYAINIAAGSRVQIYIPLSGSWARDREAIRYFISLVEAIVEGRFEEKLWSKPSGATKSEGILWTRLRGRVTVTDMTRWPIRSLPWTKPSKEIHYAPWGVKLDHVSLDEGMAS